MSDEVLELVKKRAERKLMIIKKAVSFARANLDELNEALDLEEPITEEEIEEVQQLVDDGEGNIPVVGMEELVEAEKEIREAQQLAAEKLKQE